MVVCIHAAVAFPAAFDSTAAPYGLQLAAPAAKMASC